LTVGISEVNVALAARTGDASWLRAFYVIVPLLLRQFRLQFLSASMEPAPTCWIRWPSWS
jgi:acetoin utilization deacetylase AcuC-like enzyme